MPNSACSDVSPNRFAWLQIIWLLSELILQYQQNYKRNIELTEKSALTNAHQKRLSFISCCICDTSGPTCTILQSYSAYASHLFFLYLSIIPKRLHAVISPEGRWADLCCRNALNSRAVDACSTESNNLCAVIFPPFPFIFWGWTELPFSASVIMFRLTWELQELHTQV